MQLGTRSGVQGLRRRHGSYGTIHSVSLGRPTQVFGGPQAAGLDLALDVFGTLSVTMEDLPKDGGTAAPVDDASDQVILPVRLSSATQHAQPSSLAMQSSKQTCM